MSYENKIMYASGSGHFCGGKQGRLNAYSLQFAMHDYSKLYHKQLNAMKHTN